MKHVLPRIAIVLPSLSVGGAERIAGELANHLAGGGYPVQVVTQRKRNNDFYTLHTAVERVTLGIEGAARGAFDALKRNRALIHGTRRALGAFRPDVVISFLPRTNVRTIIAACGHQRRVVICERNDITQPLSRIWTVLRRFYYRRADVLVVQTAHAAAAFRPVVGLSLPIVTIPNPVTRACLEARQAKTAATPEWWPKTPVLLCVAKLEKQKGLDLLLRAVQYAGPGLADYHIVILGEGSQRRQLIALAAELKLTDRLHLPGVVVDPYVCMRAADLFALPSRYEGFPNVLLEAMYLGCACVSFDCPAGPSDLIVDESNGLLVPQADVAAFGDAMSRLAGDAPLRITFGRAAAVSAARFLPDRVLPMWQSLIEGEIEL